MVVRVQLWSVGNVFALGSERWHCPQLSALPIGGEQKWMRSRVSAAACHQCSGLTGFRLQSRDRGNIVTHAEGACFVVKQTRYGYSTVKSGFKFLEAKEDVRTSATQENFNLLTQDRAVQILSVPRLTRSFSWDPITIIWMGRTKFPLRFKSGDLKP
ncbi:hypothetical protein RRG08_000950 [Elysia crispata]|uniref:Uncharacterized protein n=1 Tax=Elysia crispata TaxID=231223 RepID=A0AAE1AFA3_9GAST|nr:hypothetical protein RRG08_000950 [Elysia crispata]